jgi:hypothetical protein
METKTPVVRSENQEGDADASESRTHESYCRIPSHIAGARVSGCRRGEGERRLHGEVDWQSDAIRTLMEWSSGARLERRGGVAEWGSNGRDGDGAKRGQHSEVERRNGAPEMMERSACRRVERSVIEGKEMA